MKIKMTQLDLFDSAPVLLQQPLAVDSEHFYKQLSDQLADLHKATIKLASMQADNTVDTYQVSVKFFLGWCAARRIDPLGTPNIELLICEMITHMTMSGYYRSKTIATYLCGIVHWYQSKGYDISLSSKGIKKTMKGMYRILGYATRQKAPATIDKIKELIEALPDNENRTRNKAMILFGYVTACRASELLSIRMEHLQEHRDGYILTVPRSKTDQCGKGMTKIVPYGSNPDTCPVRALQDWLRFGNITSGYVFRPFDSTKKTWPDSPLSYEGLRDVLKRLTDYDPNIATHSLRAGFVTEAAKHGASEYSIAQQTGHVCMESVRMYIRMGQTFANSAATKVGL